MDNDYIIFAPNDVYFIKFDRSDPTTSFSVEAKIVITDIEKKSSSVVFSEDKSYMFEG